MHAAIRPYATAGVALVGASVIAVTPITPLPDAHIRVASPAVQLTQYPEFPPPWFFGDIGQNTLTNAGLLAQAYLAEPFPIIQAMLGNEVTAPTDFVTALGWVTYSTVSWVVAPVVNTLQDIHAASFWFTFVHDNPGYYQIPWAGAVIVSWSMAGLYLLDIPFAIAAGVLNGSAYAGVKLPGLLNASIRPSEGTPPTPTPGLIGSLIALDRAVGAAISDLFHPSSSVLAPVNEPPTPGATTPTLKTGAMSSRLIDTFIARHPVVGAAISNLFHPSSSPLAPVDEPPKPGSMSLTMKTTPVVNSGSTSGAEASVIKMAGIYGVQPNYGSITPLKSADKCRLFSCAKVRYDNTTAQSAANALAAWQAVNGDGADTEWTYSLSTEGAIIYLDTHPNDLQDTWYLLGSGSTPGYSGSGGNILPDGNYSNVYFVVRQGDKFADPTDPNASLIAHIFGYNHIDLNHPTSATVDPRTGAHVLYYARRAAAPTALPTVQNTALTTSSATTTAAPAPVTASQSKPSSRLRKLRAERQAPVNEPPTPGSTTLTLGTGATQNRLIGAFIARHQAVGAAISNLFHPSSPALAPVNELPQPGAMMLTMNTGSSLGTAAQTPVDQELGKTGTHAATPAKQGLVTAPATAAPNATEGSNTTEGLATAQANVSEHAEEGLGTARDAAKTDSPSGATDLTHGNKVTPDQGAPTDPTEHATGVLAHVQERLGKKTSHASDGLTNARNHVDNGGSGAVARRPPSDAGRGIPGARRHGL